MRARASIWIAALGALLTLACPRASEAARHRHHRNRFSNTISLGTSIGAGSPLGFLGGFLEYRPIRYVSASIGGGFGGAFGPALGASLYLDPIVTRKVAIGIGGSLSRNFSWRSGALIPEHPPLPDHSDWASLELEIQVRPTRHMFLRLGVGRAFMLNTHDFYIATEQELDRANLPAVPGQSPIDAMYAAARGQDYGVWFVHLDLATAWRL